MKIQVSLTERAILAVSGLGECLQLLRQSLLVNGRSDSTMKRYEEKIAEICFHYRKLPENFSEKEINDYLELKIANAKSYSRSEFKHVIYGLRYYYKITGLEYRNLKLPVIRSEKHLPSVLSVEECKELFRSMKNQKHRLMLMVMYSGGLRVRELLNLKISDVDTLRMMIHVRQGKGSKDRYLPLAEYLVPEMINYIHQCSPKDYLFNGALSQTRMGNSSVRHILGEALKKTSIRKKGVCAHTLRHSFATHLLEGGLDIISIKELLGHACLESTLVYLHVADCERMKKCSPLDLMYREELRRINVGEKILQLSTYAERSVKALRSSGDQLDLFE